MSSEMTPRAILVVEDEPDLAGLLQIQLRDLATTVDVEGNGLAALQRLRNGAYDLIVLDVMLPGMSGVELCEAVRARHDHIPIIMLTARSTEADKIGGLESGADDYVTKPFSMPEFLSRVRAVLRRSEQWSESVRTLGEVVIRDGLQIEISKRRVTRDGAPLQLTSKEFDLLLVLAQSPGRVFRREELLKVIWGYSHGGYRHTVDTHINRLRTRVERDPANPELILTVWGVGYRFTDVAA